MGRFMYMCNQLLPSHLFLSCGEPPVTLQVRLCSLSAVRLPTAAQQTLRLTLIIGLSPPRCAAS